LIHRVADKEKVQYVANSFVLRHVVKTRDLQPALRFSHDIHSKICEQISAGGNVTRRPTIAPTVSTASRLVLRQSGVADSLRRSDKHEISANFTSDRKLGARHLNFAAK
jgi:hypothetical protein